MHSKSHQLYPGGFGKTKSPEPRISCLGAGFNPFNLKNTTQNGSSPQVYRVKKHVYDI